MLAPNDQLSLTVDKPAIGGRMIARVAGQVVLVAGAIPGERVVARVERLAKGVAHAHTISVEKGSPDRRPTEGDPTCGGCLYSHIAYPRQLAIKSDLIVDAFTRIGHLSLPSRVTVAHSPEKGYRMRARFHLRGHRVGFYLEGTHNLCDARQTGQLLPETCDTIDRMAAALKSSGLDTKGEIDLAENVEASERVVHLTPPDPRPLAAVAHVVGFSKGPYVRDVLVVGNRADCPIAFRRHVRAFFQGNRYLLRDLVAHVIEQVPCGSALLDLYAGCGLFSVAAASLRDARVHAIEGDRFAATDLQLNARAAGGQITVVPSAVETFLRRGRSASDAIDVIIVDPPRSGLSPEALDGALRLGASRLVYVSCDVATLARDSRRIVEAGYRIARIDGFDLFPNTPHVETVVVFQDFR